MSTWQGNVQETAVINILTTNQDVLQAGTPTVPVSVTVISVDIGIWGEALAVGGSCISYYGNLAPIVTITDTYVHLPGGSVIVKEPAIEVLRGTTFQLLTNSVVAYVTEATNSHRLLENIAINTAIATAHVANILPPGGIVQSSDIDGIDELYFRIIAGRPCQIALGAANKKRIQSVSPALPASLSISSDGYYITGTPLITGTHNLTVTTDDGSQLTLTIEVLPAGLIPR